MSQLSIGECRVEVQKIKAEPGAPYLHRYRSRVALHWPGRIDEVVYAYGHTPDEALAVAVSRVEELLDLRIRRLEEQMRIEKKYKEATVARILEVRQTSSRGEKTND